MVLTSESVAVAKLKETHKGGVQLLRRARQEITTSKTEKTFRASRQVENVFSIGLSEGRIGEGGV